MENKKTYSKESIGKIINILIKINDSSIEEVAERLGIFNILMLNYAKGFLLPKEEYIDKICEMFIIKKDLFYHFVSYYDSIDNYNDIDKFKLTILYILESTLNNNQLISKNKFSFLDEEKNKVK